MIYLFLIINTIDRENEKIRDGESKSFIYRLGLSIHGDLCALSIRRADSPREINGAGRSDWMRNSHDQRIQDQNLGRFRIISLFLDVCIAARRKGKIRSGGLRSFRIYISCEFKILIIHYEDIYYLIIGFSIMDSLK